MTVAKEFGSTLKNAHGFFISATTDKKSLSSLTANTVKSTPTIPWVIKLSTIIGTQTGKQRMRVE